MNLFTKNLTDKYFAVTYSVISTKNLAEAAWDIALGQSVGNPKVRSIWETEQLFQDHSCVICGDKDELSKKTEGSITIGFPVANISIKRDGIAQLVCQILGGQVDIDHIVHCRVTGIQIPDSMKKQFIGPKYGLSGMRKFCDVYNKPLLGAIIKPKTGISPETLGEMVKELADGGVNFIKEDEILASPDFNTIEDRVEYISNITSKYKLIYSFCINGDPSSVMEKAKFVANNGGLSVHANVWSGLGVINSIRQEQIPLHFHLQKSGDQAFTHPRNPYSISWNVLCELFGLAGIDTIHSGMWGGYKSDNEYELKETLDILHKNNVVPALSCGMHPGLIEAINKRFGVDYMANVGGAIHGHQNGTLAGAKAMRQAIDGTFGSEYFEAIKTWGKID